MDFAGNWIGGKWIESRSGARFLNYSPSDAEKVLGEFANSDTDDVLGAIEAANDAQSVWSNMPAPKRGEILFKAAEILGARSE